MFNRFSVLLALIGSLAFSVPAFARGGGGHSGGHSYSSHSYSSHSSSHSTVVHGYTNSHGHYVSSYHRTLPNSTQRDNYSSKGNINPWTGKEGTKTPTH